MVGIKRAAVRSEGAPESLCSRMVADALAMEQMTPALGWKMGYVYLALPLAGIFMVLFTVENLIETLATPAGGLVEPDAAGEVE